MSVGHIEHAVLNDIHVFRFVGEVRAQNGCSLDVFLERLGMKEKLASVVVDLSHARFIDSTILGILAKLGLQLKNSHACMPVIYSDNPDINTLIKSSGLGQIYTSINGCFEIACTAEPLPDTAGEDMVKMRQTVINAHKTLMSLTPDNYERFKSIVNQLEEEQNKQTFQSSRHQGGQFF